MDVGGKPEVSTVKLFIMFPKRAGCLVLESGAARYWEAWLIVCRNNYGNNTDNAFTISYPCNYIIMSSTSSWLSDINQIYLFPFILPLIVNCVCNYAKLFNRI